MRNRWYIQQHQADARIVFSTGLLVVAAGCIRTYYLYCLGYHFDTTWIGYNCYIWSVLEVDLALICASAPALRGKQDLPLSGTLANTSTLPCQSSFGST